MGSSSGAPFGELVDVRRRRRWESAAAHDAGLFELAQPLGEHVRAALGQAGVKVGEPLGAEQQVPDDEQRPPLADQVEGVGGGASVAIGPHRGHLAEDSGIFSWFRDESLYFRMSYS